MRKLVIIFAFLALSVPAFAQKGGAAAGGKVKVYDFSGDTIEGDLSRPDGEYVEAVKRVPHSNLIKIREEYREKVMQSVDEL